MDICIFCGGPCRGNVCEYCFDEIAELAPEVVVNRLASSIASREGDVVVKPTIEDLEEG